MIFQDLRIYDKDFNLIALLPKYISVNWDIKFKGFGTGEIELEKTDEILRILTENKYLFLFQGDIQTIVTGYKIGETVTVFARTAEWLLTKFAVTEFNVRDLMKTVYSGVWSAARLTKYLLEQKLPAEFNVKFSGSLEGSDDVTDFSLKGASDLYSVIMSVMASDKAGFKFYKDLTTGRFVFEMLDAVENTDTMLCDEYKTAYESEYSYDIQSCASGGVFYHKVTNMGRWDASVNQPTLYNYRSDNYGKYYTVSEGGSTLGFRVEKGDIILCRSLNGNFEIVEKAEPFLIELPPANEGIFSWTAVLSAENTVSARNELNERKPMDMLSCKTGLLFMEDFNLGDIVQVKLFAGDKSFTKQKLISEIHLWDEPNGSGARPITTDIHKEENDVL